MGKKMKLNISLKMDKNSFVFWMIVVILGFGALVINGWDGSLITINEYQNCTTPQYIGHQPNFFNDGLGFEFIRFNNTAHNDSFNIPNFEEDCEVVTCVCYEEFGCMAKCYRC